MNPEENTRLNADEMSLAELEALVEERRRIERARRFAEAGHGFRPVTVEPESARERRPAFRLPHNLRDRLLFGLEILALVALVVVIVSTLLNLQTLNQEVVQAQAQKSGPVVAAEAGGVLPGSSFPAADAALNELPGSSFAPVAPPASLGVTLERAPALPIPTPGPQSPTRIVIPAIKVDWPIVPGDGWEELKAGVGHHVGSANPGQRGNVVLSGHNDVYGEVFKDLETVPMGETVWIYAGGRAYKYVIQTRRTVAPTDLGVIKQTREPIATLITCTPYRVDTMRLVVIAQLAP